VVEQAVPREQLQEGLLGCIRGMAGGLEGPQYLLEVVAGVASKVPAPAAIATAVLRSMHAAALALTSYPNPAVTSATSCLPIFPCRLCSTRPLAWPLCWMSWSCLHLLKSGASMSHPTPHPPVNFQFPWSLRATQPALGFL